MINYFKKLIPFAILIAIVLFILGFTKAFKPVMVFVWVCFGLFLALGIITYYFSSRTMEKKFSSFMNVFFVGIFSKLILASVIVMIFKAKNRDADISFVIPFAVIYFSFLFFETIELVKLSRRIGNNGEKKNK